MEPHLNTTRQLEMCVSRNTRHRESADDRSSATGTVASRVAITPLVSGWYHAVRVVAVPSAALEHERPTSIHCGATRENAECVTSAVVPLPTLMVTMPPRPTVVTGWPRHAAASL